MVNEEQLREVFNENLNLIKQLKETMNTNKITMYLMFFATIILIIILIKIMGWI